MRTEPMRLTRRSGCKRGTLAVLALWSVAGTVTAGAPFISSEVSMYQTPVAIPGDPTGVYYTLDLIVIVTDGDDWLLADAEASISCAGTFYDTPGIGADYPQPDEWAANPHLQYDSWYANTEGLAARLVFPEPVINEPRMKDAAWADTPPNGGVGTFVLARYTMRLSDAEAAAGDILTLDPGALPYATVEGELVTLLGGVVVAPFAYTVFLQPTCPWDLNGDDTVGITDFLGLLALWGTNPGGPPDFNGDGDVGIGDFLELLAHWGPCGSPMGGCCLDTGSCTVVTRADCDCLLGGVYQGDGAGCEPNPCPQPGACCQDNGLCVELVEQWCLAIRGATFQGEGTSCTPTNPCPPAGACCLLNGSCVSLTQVACEGDGGGFHGEGTTCTPDFCDPGACCFLDASCLELIQADCASGGGVFQGAGTDCTPNPCGGACCIPFVGCVVTNADACFLQGGAYQGDGTTCSPDPCP